MSIRRKEGDSIGSIGSRPSVEPAHVGTEPPRPGVPTARPRFGEEASPKPSPSGRPQIADLPARDALIAARLMDNEAHVYSSRNSFLPARSALEALKANSVSLMEIRLEASPQMLDPTRAFVSSYVERRFHFRTAERVALACHELLENAVSYGSVSSDVVFALVQSGQVIEVRVSNKASPGRQTMLRKHMEKLKADPEKTFLEEMTRSVSASGARAMLGLARVCHEAKMDLEVAFDGPMVSTVARCGR